MDQHEKPSWSLPRSPVHPRGTRDGHWPQSSLHDQRDYTMNHIPWSVDAEGKPGRRNYARAFEFRWSDIPGQQRCDMCEFGQPDGMVNDAIFEEEVDRWIAETRHQEDITIRLLVCKMVAKYPRYGLPLPRGAFEAIERDFGLHPATTQTLHHMDRYFDLDFTWSNRQESSSDGSVWSVIRFEPIKRNTAWTMSLRYDQGRQRTDAIFLMTQDDEGIFEHALGELLILHKSWKQFRVLPEAFMQIYLEAWSTHIGDLQWTIIKTERELGATRTWEKDGTKLHDWPQNVDVRTNAAKLHSCLYTLARARNKLAKVRQMQQALGEMDSWVKKSLKATGKILTDANELDQYSAWTDTLLRQTDMKAQEAQERAQIQADLLFSIISQQDSHESNSMAQSAFVFTFITALFLPCTVVASIFSMSMFNWQPGTESDSAASYISDKFWIYWAFSLPLTILVMGGWYWWSLKGMQIWKRSFSKADEDAQSWRAKSRWLRFLGRRPKPKSA
ncbi:hypothetical protein PFICI_00176 [Pestalotiopsis fici W106-1]|uniref:Uncharacterized protein n=1 Tax=Pestalotiopsis fici (strain W106-1 / CGMCC3.15140) TaxID=1229662 RepID=W3XJY3_PESFW|nr:uncharacterized protein PFICI_00176 [Pestalotiopsis fici W106-1]ETS86348.1 hypothetical protein PFICI_00176 [Pestalotiopsis fici W106-1]